jgi:hypothetical protein
MRLVLATVLIATCAAAAIDNPRPHVGKRTLIGSATAAGIAHARNTPHQWGRGATGFAKRFGSNVGKHVAKETIQFGVAAAHHENLRYRRSRKHGTLPRMGDAVKHTFIVPKTNRRGKKTVALGRISGNMGAGMISQAWMPAASIGAGVASGGIGLGADVGANVAREFWPRKHNRRIARRR